MEKKGLTSEQLVLFIVAAVSMAVILIFVLFYPWGPTIDKETCHQSIVLRSSFNYGPLEGKKVIPLKCQTEKICLSMSGEDCEKEFGISSKENIITKIKLDKDTSKARKEVKDAIANAMYDCHSMLGEGKLDFMPHAFYERNYCLICSRFAFDEKAKKEVGGITYGEIYQYLQEKKTPQDKSYLEYLYPGWKNWQHAKIIFNELQSSSKNGEFKKLKFEDWKINLNQEGGYAIIAQMAPKGTWEKWLNIALIGVIGTAAIASIPFSGPIGVGIAAAIGTTTTALGGITFVYEHPSGEYTYFPPRIFPYDIQTLNSLSCSIFETAS